MRRTRSTFVKAGEKGENTETESIIEKSSSDGDESPTMNSSGSEPEFILSEILQTAHEISKFSNDSEDRALLVLSLMRTIERADLRGQRCKPESKSLGCQHTLKEAISDSFVEGGNTLAELLSVLGSQLDSSLKNGSRDTTQTLLLLKNMSCTDYGTVMIAKNSQIMNWLFRKLDKLKVENNREKESTELVLGLLQKCSRKYQIQIFDGWLSQIIGTLKDLVLQQDFEMHSSHSLILLEILLNVCTSNQGRLPLIEQPCLKKILVHISEIKGANINEIRIMTARLQLLLTPFELVVEENGLAPLSINRIIKIMQKTVDKEHSPALMARCINFLTDIIKFAPNSLLRNERHWTLIAEEFLSLCESDKELWYASLAEPLLELLSALHSDEVQLVISESAAEVFNNWASEVGTAILFTMFRCQKDNAVTWSVKTKAFSVLSKSLVTEKVWSRVNALVRQEVIEIAVKDIVSAIDGEITYFGDQDYFISAAKLVTSVGKFDTKFNGSLSRSFSDLPLLQVGNKKDTHLVLACVLLATHLADSFPKLWADKVESFLEGEQVCKHLANVCQSMSPEVVLEINVTISKFLTTKGKLRLRKYLKAVGGQDEVQMVAPDLSKVNWRNRDFPYESIQRHEIVSEYEMKIKVHQLEKQQLQKCLSSTQELLDLYQCQAKLAEQERAKLVRRNLEDLARNSDLQTELHRNESKIEHTVSQSKSLKMVIDNMRSELDLKTKQMAQIEKDFKERQEQLEAKMEQSNQEKAEMKQNLTVQEQKIAKFRQLAHDNKVEMAKQEEALERKDEQIKTLKETNQEMMLELDDLTKFKENILNITSKTSKHSK